ncbi:hypothetical protein BJ875DRAFT_526798 [Amylocarpus encephaloides]|uniref:Uncharacterized protein n=1 Tax=Amylocarpus encephaloides TaxID=45428 RepID=A0A9P7YN43_9HELO|nr:hypothetical protein BJ875DRAFT_526798 [Amylocarpus encephaloides]
MSPYSSDMEGSPQPCHEYLGSRNTKHREEVEANIQRDQGTEDGSIRVRDMEKTASTNTIHVTPKKSVAKKKDKSLSFVAAHGSKVPANPAINVETVEAPKEPNRPKKIKSRNRSVSTTSLADAGEKSWEDVDEPIDPLSIPHSLKSKGKSAKTPNKNGRFHGRQLVNWHRARMMEKLILHLQYECQREGIQLPWDKTVHRLMPGSSGTAALQYLNRLRGFLVTEGHLVPPLIGKLGSPQESNIRGYIRDMSSDDITQTRVVGWDESIEDLKESLVVPGIVRGSGIYRQKMVEERDGLSKETAVKVDDVNPGSASKKSKNTLRKHRAHSSVSCVKYPSPESTSDNTASNTILKTPKRKSRSTKRLSESKNNDRESDSDEVDPADLDSDDEYNPQITKKVRTGRKPSPRTSKHIEDADDSDATAHIDNEEERDPFRTPKSRVNKKSICGLMTPHSPSNNTPGLVKLQLNPRDLKSFQTGRSDNLLLESMLKSSFKSPNRPTRTVIGADNEGDTAILQDSPSAARSNRLSMPKKDDPFVDDIEEQSGNVYASFNNETGLDPQDIDDAKTEPCSPRSHLDELENQSLVAHQEYSSLLVYGSSYGEFPDIFYNQDNQDFSSQSMQTMDMDIGPEDEFGRFLNNGYDNSYSLDMNAPFNSRHYSSSTSSRLLGSGETSLGSSQNSTYDDDVFYNTSARSPCMNSSVLNSGWEDDSQQQSPGGIGRGMALSRYQHPTTQYNGGSYHPELSLPQHEGRLRGSTNTAARHALPQLYEDSPFADVSQYNLEYEGDFDFNS